MVPVGPIDEKPLFKVPATLAFFKLVKITFLFDKSM